MTSGGKIHGRVAVPREGINFSQMISEIIDLIISELSLCTDADGYDNNEHFVVVMIRC